MASHFIALISVLILLWSSASSGVHVSRLYPPSISEDVAYSTSESRAKITFVGDVLLARDVEVHQRRHGQSYPFERMSFPSNSYVVGNFESAIPRIHQMTPHLVTRFSSPTTSASVLRDAGFTHLSLANNHTYDFGSDGFTHTQMILSAADIAIFGHPIALTDYATTYISINNLTIAVIAINEVFNQLDVTALQAVMQVATARSDRQIVYIHWGPEYELKAAPAQRQLAEFLVSAGADLIIGHHPHVVQDIERINGVLVVYSLGNFVFDQYFSRAVQEGLMVVVEPATDTLQLLPVTSIDSRTQPRYMNQSERNVFLRDIAARSDSALTKKIVEGLLPLGWAVATSSETAIITE